MRRLIYACAAAVAVLVLIVIVFWLSRRLPTPPAGFDARREGIQRGKVETVEYHSKAAGGKRRMRVYTPPGFSEDEKYPVLYLLHGSMANENSWVNDGALDNIFDNLYADQRLVPMIVVMPNCNLLKLHEKSPDGLPGFDAFGLDLLDDVIPCVEKRFPVKADREHRALAGLSAGVVQTLNFGLTRPDTFAYIGTFIGGLWNCEQFEKQHQEVLQDLGTNRRLRLLWIANGEYDITYTYCQNTRKLLDKYGIPYVYKEGKGFHDWETARNDLFVFAPLLFRNEK